VEGADIICTLTNSPTPVLSGDWLEPGQHLNVVGASVASKREIDDAAVLRAAVYCDYLPSLLAQAGEVAAMVSAGTITQAHLRGEIGAVLLNRVQGRQRPDEITLYRSLGIVAQDLAVAHHVLAGAEAAGRGTLVNF
jgi:alanine dehydrogenase